jgi:argininosuccinate lyase
MAHVRSLVDAGVIDTETGSTLLSGLVAVHNEPTPDLDPALGDLYNNREVLLRDRLGDMADQIHTGRARREATTVAWHLETRARAEEAIGALSHLVQTLTDVVEKFADAPMSDFTYLQHAHPTTLGHYLLTFAYPLSRDLERLAAALSQVNRSPAGSGSVNGSRFPIDRDTLARDLEFDGLILHNRDAMWAPDIALEPVAAAMSSLITIDRLAEELQIWASSEFGYFEPADRHARTSVIMPQKKNPYGLAMIRGHARDALGIVVSVVTTNLTPSGQPDNRVAAYGKVPAILRTVSGTATLLAEHVEFGQFDTARMDAASRIGFTFSTEICDWMTLERGVTNRSAHSLVGKAVRVAIERGADQLAIEDLEQASRDLGMDLPPISPEELASLQDPATIIRERKTRDRWAT